MVIKDWAASDQPREKLLASGEASLSDAELLAILLRTGMQGRNVMEVSRELLHHCDNSLERLTYELQSTAEKDCREHLKSIGPAKQCTLRAAIELGRRMEAERIRNAQRRLEIKNAEDIASYMRPRLQDLDHEEMWALYLSRSGKLLKEVCIGKGSVSGTPSDIRMVCRPAIQYMASYVALCHNHPHSFAKAGPTDIRLTQRIIDALALFDVKLLEHVVIADTDFYPICEGEGL